MIKLLKILDEFYENFGVGFFTSPNGYILTCNHVLLNAGYFGVGDEVLVADSASNEPFTAIWVASRDAEDLAILRTYELDTSYFMMCDQGDVGDILDTYGFPHGSDIAIKASVRFDQQCNNGMLIQLGNANTVTNGFSGSPVFYNNTVIGLVNKITKTDKNGRMIEVAFAISAKCVLKHLKRYVHEMTLCIGYKEKKGNCQNYAFSTNQSYCQECYSRYFNDSIIAFFTAQNYKIKKFDVFFVIELSYVVSKYMDAVVPVFKPNDSINTDDLIHIKSNISSKNIIVSQIIIISSSAPNKHAKTYASDNSIRIITKDELLRSLFDFAPYREDLRKHVESEHLSTHFIDVYGTERWGNDSHDSFIGIEEEYDNIFDEDFDEYNEDDILFEDQLCYDEKSSYSNSMYIDEHIDDDIRGLLLRNYVNDFIKSSHRALLLLGDYGCGKTSFCYTYALNALDGFLSHKSSFLPILIKLRNYNKAVGVSQILTDYFVNDLGINNFNLATFNLMLRNLDVILIFDGFDEVAKKVDFDVKHDVLKEICKYAIGNTKIIVTCRPNYFQNAYEFKKIFEESHFPYEPGETSSVKFIENTISELNSDQVEFYLNSYSNVLNDTGIVVSDMIETITNTHDLSDLAKRPFLLYMIVNTLPKIIQESKREHKSKINAATLYSVYTDVWIKREDDKNKTLIKKYDKELFCKEFAYELFVSDSLSLSYKEFPIKIKKHFKHLERAEDIDYFTHDIQSCSFLTSDRSGEFRFIHKSFMEYFVAELIVGKMSNCLDSSAKKTTITKKLNAILGEAHLSMEICLFLNDFIHDGKFKETDKLIGYLKEVSSITMKNILSLVSKTNLNMSDVLSILKGFENIDIERTDLSYSKFEGKMFENISFDNSSFYFSSFESIWFNNCSFNGAIFEKSTLKNVQFSNCQFTQSVWRNTEITKCVFKFDFDEIISESIKMSNEAKQYFDNYIDYVDATLHEQTNLCPFWETSWINSTINSCIFESCDMTENKFISSSVNKTSFTNVDFYEATIMGSRYFENNEYYDVRGTSYGFK